MLAGDATVLGIAAFTTLVAVFILVFALMAKGEVAGLRGS
tara:strand:- start:4971 stop:5090 length:120 start_codon:yes stop_codon:yes gene_type:complete